ncbi:MULTISPECIES: cytochrome c [unclassified Stenotrophomonas maltophilia group]|uniref:c-type cytochrome n=1 Tax=unclassified Stenotrophomonas maltophilia group TaxID=2961925 RepID=UPI000D53DE50|nr:MULTISPECIES: cytochrome c [unclassified Stenotrophomonas maltophilia group]AWH28417.1 cytochrome C [Stenotrophomonas sp. YAU14A_MKIMI4_1]AWH32409.1 cytochrome C [Stenotrophomonas sp. SAU14A_NAIMI4_8]
MKTVLTLALTLCTAAAALPAWCKEDPAAGAKLYATNCVACHGADRAGMPGAFPALTDIGKRLPPAQIKEKISKGGGLMPPFPHLSAQEIDDIASFLAK